MKTNQMKNENNSEEKIIHYFVENQWILFPINNNTAIGIMKKYRDYNMIFYQCSDGFSGYLLFELLDFFIPLIIPNNSKDLKLHDDLTLNPDIISDLVEILDKKKELFKKKDWEWPEYVVSTDPKIYYPKQKNKLKQLDLTFMGPKGLHNIRYIIPPNFFNKINSIEKLDENLLQKKDDFDSDDYLNQIFK